MRAQQREVGPDRERHQRDHDQEEQHADQRAAAEPHGQPHVAQEEGGEGGHALLSANAARCCDGRSCRGVLPSPLCGADGGRGRGWWLRVRTQRYPPPLTPPPQARGRETRPSLRRSSHAAPRSTQRNHPPPPSRSSFAPSRPIGPWVAARIMPPPARWSRISSASIACAAASSAEVGSSSSQSGRSTAISRAIESRRRWPAER